MLAAGAIALIGGSVGATLFLTGYFSAPPVEVKEGAKADGEKGGEGSAEETDASGEVAEGEEKPSAEIPESEKFTATYKPIERDFTLNVPNSRKFVQFKIAYKTFYGEKIAERVTKHQIAIEAAVIATTGQFGEEEMTSLEGRTKLVEALRDAMNDVLIRNEDFGGVDEVMLTHFVFQ
jgi:flagellar FliL protein